jgi:hypothetical protein
MAQKIILAAFAITFLACLAVPSSHPAPQQTKADSPECKAAIIKNFNAHMSSNVLTVEYADKLNDQLNSACGTNF